MMLLEGEKIIAREIFQDEWGNFKRTMNATGPPNTPPTDY